MRFLRIVRAGLHTTVQDRGRLGWSHLGVARSGSLDSHAAEIANRLVLNDPSCAVLEMTWRGDELVVSCTALLATTGADMQGFWEWNGNTGPWPHERPVLVREGTRLRFSGTAQGSRSYLALAGGLDCREVLSSRSTLTRAKLGGWNGRKLQADDQLPLGQCDSNLNEWMQRTLIRSRQPIWSPKWYVPSLHEWNDLIEIRFLWGSHRDHLTPQQQGDFTRGRWKVTHESDRMGMRLEGMPLQPKAPEGMLSEGVTVGTIQLPPQGQPILLLADGAPTGGYPRLGHVIAADLFRLGQVRPGQSLRFTPVSLREAYEILHVQQREWSDLYRAIEHYWSEIRS